MQCDGRSGEGLVHVVEEKRGFQGTTECNAGGVKYLRAAQLAIQLLHGY